MAERELVADLLCDAGTLALRLTDALQDRQWLDAYLFAAGLSQVLDDRLHSDPLLFNRAADYFRGRPSRTSRVAGAAADGLAAATRADHTAAGRRLLTARRPLAELTVRLAARVLDVGSTDAPVTGALGASGLAALLKSSLPGVPPVAAERLRIPSCFHSFDQHPDDVRWLVRAFRDRYPRRDVPLCVVAVRTSGSYLAPLHAAALRTDTRARIELLSYRPGRPFLRGERTFRCSDPATNHPRCCAVGPPWCSCGRSGPCTAGSRRHRSRRRWPGWSARPPRYARCGPSGRRTRSVTAGTYVPGSPSAWVTAAPGTRPGSRGTGCAIPPPQASFARSTSTSVRSVIWIWSVTTRYSTWPVRPPIHRPPPSRPSCAAGYERASDEHVDGERWLLYRLAQLRRLDVAGDLAPHAVARRSAAAVHDYLAALYLHDLPVGAAASWPPPSGPLCAIDLDGVLECDRLGFSPTSPTGMLGLRALIAHGYRPVLATGRSAPEVRDRCRAFGLAGGVAEYGAAVYSEGQVTDLRPVGADTLLGQIRKELSDRPGVAVDPDYRYAVRARFGSGPLPGLGGEIVTRRRGCADRPR